MSAAPFAGGDASAMVIAIEYGSSPLEAALHQMRTGRPPRTSGRSSRTA